MYIERCKHGLGRGISKPTIEILQGDFSLLYLIGYSPIALAKNSLGHVACLRGLRFFVLCERSNSLRRAGVPEHRQRPGESTGCLAESLRLRQPPQNRRAGTGHEIHSRFPFPTMKPSSSKPESFRWRKSLGCTECRCI